MDSFNLSVLAETEATIARWLAVVVLLVAVPATFRAKVREGCSPAVVLLAALCMTNAGFAVRLGGEALGIDAFWDEAVARALFILGALMTIRAALSWLGNTTWLAVGAIATLAIGAATWPLYWG